MKKTSKKLKVKVVRGNSFEELNINKSMEYPFDKELLDLLKEENKFEQEYYYIEYKNDYAFFVLYKNKMNIFTFGKLKCFINLKVIGYPCSLSNCGYITNNEKFMLDFIKTIKGAKLVLNVKDPIIDKEMTLGKTLPTCIFHNSFSSIEEYLSSLRSGYRRRINIALNKCRDIRIEEIHTTRNNEYNKQITKDYSGDIHKLYLNTYNKSEYKLERLEKGFFEKVNADKLVFIKDNNPIGFVLLKRYRDMLIFMLCGMDYNYETADLYYYMLFNIIRYAIEHQCKIIDFGQTSEETKMKFGAFLEAKYFYAHHTNIILNKAVKMGKSLLEYNYRFKGYRVFKEKKT